MNRIAALLAATAVAAAAVPAAAQTAADTRMDAAQRRFDSELSLYRQAVDRYRDEVRRAPGGPGGGYYDPRDGRDPRYDDPRYSDYPANYDWEGSYRPSNAAPRYLTREDTVYYGSDNRAYCRRSDGTTGLVVGAALGGIFGNVVDGGRQRVLGTLLGGAGGALLGRNVDQQRVTCR